MKMSESLTFWLNQNDEKHLNKRDRNQSYYYSLNSHDMHI